MLRFIYFFLFLAAAMGTITGCSGKNSQPVTTPTAPSISDDSALPFTDADISKSNRILLGTWSCELDSQTMTGLIIPTRTTETHFNLTPYKDSILHLKTITYKPNGNVELKFEILNPTPVNVYDARLIVWVDPSVGEVANPDDWIALWDFPGGPPVNPFIACVKDSPNRILESMTEHTVILEIDPINPSISFDIAIDASFPDNCKEPYEISGFTQGILYDAPGSSTDTTVNIYDWQNNVNGVYLHCPEITSQTAVPFTQISSRTWQLNLINDAGASSGVYTGYIIATSPNAESIALFDEVKIPVFNHGVEPSNPRIVNSVHVSGYYTDVAVEGGYAYALVKNIGMYVIDIDPPESAYIAKTVYFPGYGTDIVISNDYAYISIRDGVLLIVDIDPLDSSHIIGEIYIPGESRGLAVSGNYLIVADGSRGVEIFNIVIPDHPVFVKNIPTNDAYGIYKYGDYAYVSDGASGLKIISIQTLSVVGSIDTPGFALNVAVSSSLLANVSDSMEGLQIIDVTIPGDPTNVQAIDSTAAIDAKLAGNYIYVASANKGLRIIDESNFDTIGFVDTNGMAQAVDVEQNYAYIADGLGGLKIIELWSSTAQNPSYSWVKTFGGLYSDKGYKTATDDYGNCYIAGTFCGEADLDPGPDADWHSSLYKDVFFSKFDSNGNLIWAKSLPGWGRNDSAYGMFVSDSNNVYLTGSFAETIEFDPGPPARVAYSQGGEDVFISIYNSNGDFVNGITLGGVKDERGLDICVSESGEIYVTGYFMGSVDFDPGPGTDLHNSHGGADPFITKFLPDCAYSWTQTWGSISAVEYCNAITMFDSNNIFVTGKVNSDLFVRKFDSSGNLLNEKTWVADGEQSGYSIGSDSYGNIIITGGYENTLDFNPGAGTDIHTSINGKDVLLIKLSGNLDYIWGRTWGGMGIWDEGHGLAVNHDGDVFITGTFENQVDFNPGIGEDWHTSIGGRDVFLSKFDQDGNFIWSREWGDMGIWDEGHGLSVDRSGNIFITGNFSDTVDFDPGLQSDNYDSIGDNDVFIVRYTP